MSEELQTLLESSRRMVETRDMLIKDLERDIKDREREIKEVKTDREFIRGWAVRCQNEMDHQASLVDIARTKISELNAMLHGTCKEQELIPV